MHTITTVKDSPDATTLLDAFTHGTKTMIHVLGSINIDYAVNVKVLPSPGETVSGQHLVLTPGGKGANQALAAKRAGAEVQMTGAVGTDSVADAALSLLTAGGVDLSGVKHLPGPTGCAFVFVDDNSENQIVIIAGANGGVSVEQARAVTVSADDVLLLQLECPVDTVIAAANYAKQKGTKVVVNLAPYQSLPASVFKDIDYLLINETEADSLSRDLGLESGTVTNIANGTGCSVVKTLGASGIEAFDEQSRTFTLPGIRVDAIDTVGAGDTFAGFLGTMLSQGNSLQNACKVANVAAALACTKPGAQAAIPTMQDVINLASNSQ